MFITLRATASEYKLVSEKGEHLIGIGQELIGLEEMENGTPRGAKERNRMYTFGCAPKSWEM